MGRKGTGVEARDRSVRISFTLDGEACKETLMVDGAPMPPTPRNLKYANSLGDEIRNKIRHGTFVYADYFPQSSRVKPVVPAPVASAPGTFAEAFDAWIATQVSKGASTLRGYNKIGRFWKAHLGHKPMAQVIHSNILTALASKPEWTGKTINNNTSVLRRFIQVQLRDGVIARDPLAGIEHSEHQRPEPDPFDMKEAELILAALKKRYGDQVARYFEFKFFTGLRTSESIALKWAKVDWIKKTVRVDCAVVEGKFKATTKTKRVRNVQLNSRAIACLKAQKASTFLHPDGWVFHDPLYGTRWDSDRRPREDFWDPTLKLIGVRHRGPYNTRHTYATKLLMAGATPGWAAAQMGHSVMEFLRTYAKWIDGGQNDIEMSKLETLLHPNSSPVLPRTSAVDD